MKFQHFLSYEKWFIGGVLLFFIVPLLVTPLTVIGIEAYNAEMFSFSPLIIIGIGLFKWVKTPTYILASRTLMEYGWTGGVGVLLIASTFLFGLTAPFLAGSSLLSWFIAELIVGNIVKKNKQKIYQSNQEVELQASSGGWVRTFMLILNIIFAVILVVISFPFFILLGLSASASTFLIGTLLFLLTVIGIVGSLTSLIGKQYNIKRGRIFTLLALVPMLLVVSLFFGSIPWIEFLTMFVVISCITILVEIFKKH